MTKKRLLMHVGLPKTGTTTIQNTLAAQADALEGEGVLFPTVGRSMRDANRESGAWLGWHQPLLALFQGRADQLPMGEEGAWRAEFRRFARSSSLDTLVVSHELIGLQPRQFDFEILKDAGEVNLEIVLVLRSAETWLASFYEQNVRGRGRQHRLPDDFPLVRRYITGGFEAMIAALETAFPEARMLVSSYETMTEGSGLVKNFAGLAGIPIEDGRVTPISENRRLPQSCVAVLRLINALDLPEAQTLPLRRALVKSQRSDNPEARLSLFSAEIADNIAARYELDRAYVAQRFDVALPPEIPLDRSRIAPMTVTIEDVYALETALAPLSRSEERGFDLIYAHPDFADGTTRLPPPRSSSPSRNRSRAVDDIASPTPKRKDQKIRKAPKRPAVKIIRNIPYGVGRVALGDLELEMDAYLPRKVRDARPVQLIHGGGFGGGSRVAEHLVRLATALAERGFAAFSIDYRLSGENAILETMSAERAEEIAEFTGYPEAVYALAATEDAAKARAYVDARRDEFGIGSGGWSVVGNSAGAVAALMTGYAGSWFWGKKFDVAAVVDMWGTLPAELMSAGDPPLLIVHGTADKRLPYEASTELVEQGAEVGVTVERITMDGVEHGSRAADIFERPYESGTIADRIIDFLDEHAPG